MSGRKPKIVQITDRYLPAVGGVERHVFELSKKLRSLGLDVTVLTTDLLEFDPITRIPKLVEGGVSRFSAYRLLPLPQGLGFVSPSMVGALAGADLVHSHGYGRFPTFLAPICRILGIPCVVTTHSGWGSNSISKLIFDAVVPSFTLAWADRVIAMSNQEVAYLKSIGISRQVVLIPNGVDLEEFKRVAAARRKDGTINLLYVGRLEVYQKGLDVAVDSLAILVREKGMKVAMTMIGPGSESSVTMIRDRAQMLGIADNLSILPPPPRMELVKRIKSTDLLVLPSRVESSPLVLLEAMAAGTPVVASNVGGVPDLLEYGKLGYLTEPGKPIALADAIERAIKDAEQTELKQQNASKAAEDHDWGVVARKVYEVYMSLLRKN